MKVPQITISEDQVLLKDFGQEINFFEHHAVVKCVGKWNVVDTKIAMKKELYVNTVTYISPYCKLERSFDSDLGADKNGLWVIYAEEWQFFFKTEGDANALFDVIAEWKSKYFSQ